MADNPAPHSSGVADLLRVIAPYAPVFGGAVLSMAFGEKLTIRGKLLSASVGLAAALWVAPALVDLLGHFWPGGNGLPTSVVTIVGFACGAFGMIVLSGLAQALAKYSRDPLSLVRVQIGNVIITGGASRGRDRYDGGPE